MAPAHLHERIKLLKQDIFQLDGFSRDYDMATGVFVLHHIENKEKAVEFLKKLKSILKPDAGIVFVDFIRPRSALEKRYGVVY